MIAVILVAAGMLIGPAQVVDGDTLSINGIVVRMKGVDAPESTAPGGREATQALRRLADGRTVRCELTGEKTRGREVGWCYAGTVDLGAELVRMGAVRACPRYSNRYVSEEAAPRAARRGVWSNERPYAGAAYCRSSRT